MQKVFSLIIILLMYTLGLIELFKPNTFTVNHLICFAIITIINSVYYLEAVIKQNK